ELFRGGSLRAQAPARDRARGIALDLTHALVVDEHLLPAADRAVRADRVDGLVRRRGPWHELVGSSRARRTSPGRPVALRLTQQRQPPEQCKGVLEARVHLT